jgi:hypothetical protein
MIAKKYWYLGCLWVSMVYAQAPLTEKPPITSEPAPPSCGCWQETAVNDVANADRHCMMAYLKQYTTKAKQYGRVGSQRFSLPIVGGFPAQRLAV